MTATNALLALILLATQASPAADPSQVAVASAPAPDVDELAVMTAVLDLAWRPGSRGWVMLVAHTATFECNPPPPIGFAIGGCAGMRVAGQAAEEALALVRGAMPQVSVELTRDLLGKSRRSVTLSQTLKLPIRQSLWAPDMLAATQPEGDPDFAVYFSRVGLDAKRLRALVYLGTIHWTDQTKSVGQYLYLEKHGGTWVVKDHFKVWELGRPAS